MSPEASMFDHRTEHGIPLAVGTLDELVLVASDFGHYERRSVPYFGSFLSSSIRLVD